MTKLEAFDTACELARKLILEGGYPSVSVELDDVTVTCACAGLIDDKETFEFKEANDED